MKFEVKFQKQAHFEILSSIFRTFHFDGSRINNYIKLTNENLTHIYIINNKINLKNAIENKVGKIYNKII